MGHAPPTGRHRPHARHGTGQQGGLQTGKAHAPGPVPGAQKPRRLRLRERAPARRIHQGAADRPRFRGQGAGPRVLRQDGTRKDPPGHRPGHARHRARQEREVPADRGARAPARQGQTRRRPRQPAQGPRPCRPDHPRRVRLRARAPRRGPSPLPDHRRQLRTSQHHPPPRTSSSANGGRSSPTTNSPPRSSTASSTTDASSNSPAPADASAKPSCSARRTTSKTNHRPALLMPKRGW